MTVWALSDPHLSFGVHNKKMNIFGPQWDNHEEKIKSAWCQYVSEGDLVLMPGDISWAMRPEEVLPDLLWIDSLPGTKLIIRGNHDYWWGSYGKVVKLLPPSIHAIQNNTYDWGNISIGGARLWDTSEYDFHDIIELRPDSAKTFETDTTGEAKKIFDRELQRLEMSLKLLNPNAPIKIALTHYPPIGLNLSPTLASHLLEKYEVNFCIFGHLHSLKKNSAPFGKRNGVEYHLASCDYLDFIPKRVI